MQTVIFDFDGTIADTFVTSIRIFEKLTKRPAPFTDEQIEQLRNLTVVNLIRELHIRPWRIPWLLVRGRAMMRREMASIHIFDGMEDVFKQLQAAGTPMYIMSSNSTINIRQFLARLGLDHYFKHIQGNVSILGKTNMLRRLIERHHLDPTTTFYVGDEGRDVESAKHAGLKAVAVSWGFSSAGLLASHKPHALASTPAELARILAG